MASEVLLLEGKEDEECAAVRELPEEVPAECPSPIDGGGTPAAASAASIVL